MSYDLDGILEALNANQQRATYAAVAALVGESPRSLMRGKPREQRNSWIVAKDTGRPSGYAESDVHPNLLSRERVLATREELASWLAARQSM